jgi:hypothetical protein
MKFASLFVCYIDLLWDHEEGSTSVLRMSGTYVQHVSSRPAANGARERAGCLTGAFPSADLVTLPIKGAHISRSSLINSDLPLPETSFAPRLNLPF